LKMGKMYSRRINNSDNHVIPAQAGIHLCCRLFEVFLGRSLKLKLGKMVPSWMNNSGKHVIPAQAGIIYAEDLSMYS